MADLTAEDIAGAALSEAVGELLRQRLRKTIQVQAPAAGAEWTTLVPGGVTWTLLSVTHTLATSAIAGNRSPQLVVTDEQGVTVATYPFPAVVAASLTVVQGLESGYGGPVNTNSNYGPLPDPARTLRPGSKLSSVTAAKDVGDQYSAIALTVIEWNLVEVVQAAEWLGRRLASC